MKIAVVGAGISGLSCAWHLSQEHSVTLYEADRRLGGHANTVDVVVDGLRHPVDTGFLVFNRRTYPELVKLFAELDVATAPSEMSFSARIDPDRAGAPLEWSGSDLNSVFAQRRNVLRPRFLRMLADIARFNRRATALAASADVRAVSLRDFLARESYSAAFRDWYLLPMAAAIWSCPTAQMLEFPLVTFLRFCHNHGLLQVRDRPQWYTVVGGGREYVNKLAAAISVVRTGEAVLGIRRPAPGGPVALRTAAGVEMFDQVVLATHSDQALGLLDDASPEETRVLGAISYQRNHAIVHTDTSVLPRSRRAWAAWNYQSGVAGGDAGERAVCLHYLLNKLQPLPFRRPVLVSLNPYQRPAAQHILAEVDYAHPVFDSAAIAAQQRLPAIQRVRATWFCGAWTGYGFHEDGLKSGLAVARAIAHHADLAWAA